MTLAKRALNIAESITLSTNSKATDLRDKGRDVLSLTLGEPDFVTPKNIREKAMEAIADGRASFYTCSSGLPELKDAVASYFDKFYGYSIDRKQILVGTGAKFILYVFFMSVLNQGDEVLIPTPYWGSYVEQVKLALGTPIFVETSQDQYFKVSPDQLDEYRTVKTKVLVLNSPSNPTGMVYSKEELMLIGQWAVKHGIIILADDIYGRLVYNDVKFIPISSLSLDIRRQTLTVTGLSKTYSMTGWRVGVAVGDSNIISAMRKIISHTTSSVPTVSQYAAIEAFTGEQETAEKMRQAFENRLNTIYPLLLEVPGFDLLKPSGAFYLFPNVRRAMEMKGFDDVTEFTNSILETTGVSLVTGAGFGSSENLRLSYATDLITLTRSIARIKSYMEF